MLLLWKKRESVQNKKKLEDCWDERHQVQSIDEGEIHSWERCDENGDVEGGDSDVSPRWRKSDSAGETIQVEGDEERGVNVESGESVFGERIVGIESNNGNVIEVSPQYTVCDDESKEEKSRDVQNNGGSVDSWDEASATGRLEYEMHMDNEEGWNMGLRSLKSLGSEAEEVISTEFEGLERELGKTEPKMRIKREMKWGKKISTVHRTEGVEDQLSTKIRDVKKKSWWDNINNWYVKKFDSIQGQQNEEEIIFLEDSEFPFHERNDEEIDLRRNDEWENETKLGNFAMSTQRTQESLIYESLENTSESESEMTIGLQDDHMDLHAYMEMQQNQKPTRRRKILRRLINSQSQLSLSTECEEVAALSLIKQNPIMMKRREYGDGSNELWPCGKPGRKKEIRSAKVQALLNEIESCGASNESSKDTYQLCVLEEISLDEPCSEKFSLHVERGHSTIQNEKGDANKLCEKRKVTRQQTCVSKEGWSKCDVGGMKTLRAIGKSNTNNEVPSASFLTMTEQCKQTLPKAIYIVDAQKLNMRSKLMNTIPWRDTNTVRGGNGGKVNTNIFLSQLNDINEACLQQRANGHVAKTRDQDLFSGLKQQTNASEVVRILESDANSVNNTINAMKQQESDSNSQVKSQSMRQHLSFLPKQSQNNVMLNHKSYLRKARARMSIHCQDMNRSPVICAQSFMKFSLSGERKILPNELRMTSVEKEKNCQVTGFKDGTELANAKSIEGKSEADPSTYPTGCPNNYFDCLNKPNIKS